jgi:hypothetical protein
MGLRLLTIGIITALLSIVIPKSDALCPAGEFPMYAKVTSPTLRPFVSRAGRR